MLGSLVEWAIDRRIAGLDFSGQAGPEDAALVADIMRHFKTGMAVGLGDISKAVALADRVPWTRRLFFWEGVALGASARHACLWRPGNPFKRYPASGYRFMFWTGLGFWNGVARPMPPISHDLALWADVPEFEHEYALVVGGAGFSLTSSLGRLDTERLEAMPCVRGAHDLEGLYMGVGRALWFLYMHNFPRLKETLDSHPRQADFLALGLGVAMTLTQLPTPERILSDIGSLPEKYWLRLLAGSRTAFAGLLMDDPGLTPNLAALPGVLADLVAEAREGMIGIPPGAGWQQRFAERCEYYGRQWDGLIPPALAVSGGKEIRERRA